MTERTFDASTWIVEKRLCTVYLARPDSSIDSKIPTRAGMSRPQRPWAVGYLFLAHSLAVTEVFVQLVEAARGTW
ncbi:MAG: hypothetical protein ACJ74U_13770 [Jatrophihabitantaceae bacterium]